MHCFDKLYKKTKPYLKKIKRKITPKSQVKVLLLTNRDSDNVGDQVIEATDISLISTVMKNLGLHRWEYEIISKAVSFVSQGYLKNRNPKLLEPAEKAIRNCDIVVFGGAPMFNYMYQNFYERTAVTIEIAQKYQKPVFFSAIGLEHYDEQNKKCQRLKKALNLDCVKMITTRDDFEMLQKYKEKESLYIDKVADPAVHTCTVFRKFWIQKKPGRKKKIGIFILREGGFTDNKIPFSKEEAIQRLYSPAESDTLDYEFWNDNGEYYIKVKGIKRFQQMNGVLTAAFKVDFIQQNGKNYMVVDHINNMQLLYSAGYEAELFEFMTKKLNCVPVSKEIIKVDCYN